MRLLSWGNVGADKPSQVLAYLVGVTAAVTLMGGLFDLLMRQTLGWYGLQELLALSWQGIYSGFLWQPLTHLLVYQPYGGINLGLLIGLGFHLYLLYQFGSAVMNYTGVRSFLKLYFLSGVLAGVVGLLAMQGLGYYTFIAGAGPAVFGVLTVWAMLYPDLDLMLFGGIPIKSRWMVFGLLILHLLIDVSNAQWIDAIVYITGAATGHLYGVIGWDLRGPFPATHQVERFLAGATGWIRKERTIYESVYTKSKIVDIHTGDPVVDDEAFMDEMLAKISAQGESSLTRSERKRMKKISEKSKKD